ncbi:MAG: hypothetical protein A2046_03100 [Bacteroidetes bacterium GWA2_30_7]|nr:MAG: hypothetical protein A2046_03100 [Bacteroidetes bacterium GWA2_30_7]
MNIQLSLSVNDELFNKIEVISKKMQIEKNDLIVTALRKFLLIQEIKLTRKKLKKHLLKQGYKNEEDIFNAIS